MSTTVQVFDLHVGDGLQPIGIQCRRPGVNGAAPTNIDISDAGDTMSFYMVDEDGTAVIAETETNVTKIDDGTAALRGKVQFSFEDDISGVAAGTYYGYFVRTDSSSRRETFPVEERALKIIVHGDA